MNELNKMMGIFARSSWDLIEIPAENWLAGNRDSEPLIDAVRQADEICASCGCIFDPLYKKALALRVSENEAYKGAEE